MGLFDIFSGKNAKRAADARVAGLNAGYDKAAGAIDTGLGRATDLYGQAMTPFDALSGTADKGFQSYGDAIGLNGPEGQARAKAAFTSQPGYQSGIDMALDQNDRRAAARGMLGSGNTIADTTKLATDYADQKYSNYLSSFAPMLSAAPAIAGARSGISTRLGDLNYQGGSDLANLGWKQQTGIGDANAAGYLGQDAASGNLWGAIMNGAKTAAGYAGSTGGAAALSSLFALSDKRAKEDVEPVGKLADGQTVYRYRYKGEPRTQIGLIAQDVERREPEAVGRRGAMKTVDYKKATNKAARRASMGDFARAA